MRRAERGEVVAADQHLCGAVHRVGIESGSDAPCLARIEGERRAAIYDAIFIMACKTRKSCVKIVGDGFAGEDGNGVRAQAGVDPFYQTKGRDRAGDIHVCDHAEAVDAGIGGIFPGVGNKLKEWWTFRVN